METQGLVELEGLADGFELLIDILEILHLR